MIRVTEQWADNPSHHVIDYIYNLIWVHTNSSNMSAITVCGVVCLSSCVCGEALQRSGIGWSILVQEQASSQGRLRGPLRTATIRRRAEWSCSHTGKLKAWWWGSLALCVVTSRQCVTRWILLLTVSAPHVAPTALYLYIIAYCCVQSFLHKIPP